MSAGKTLSYIGSAIGIATVLCILLKLSSTAYIFLRPSRLSKYLRKDKDTYALVTGASDGIGLGFARELCRRGFSVILHGRNEQKLSRIQETLQGEFPNVKLRTFVCDASAPNPPETFDRLVRELADVNLTMLINNVGGQAVAQDIYNDHTSYTPDEIDRLMDVNMRFMTQLTRVLIPMLNRNGPSLLLNVSSIGAAGIPYVAVYSGTKAYVRSFSVALSMEMRMQKKNIDVVTLNVAEVHSSSYQVPTNFFVPTGQAFARSALGILGYGSEELHGYFPHAIQSGFVAILPEWMRQKIVMQTIKSKMAQSTNKRPQLGKVEELAKS